MRFYSALLLASAVMISASCAPEIFSVRIGGGEFTIRTSAGTLTLRNGARETVHHVAVEEKTAALIDLHFDPQQWPGLAPGSEVRTRYGAITGYTPGAKSVRIYYWTRSGGYGHTSIELRL